MIRVKRVKKTTIFALNTHKQNIDNKIRKYYS